MRESEFDVLVIGGGIAGVGVAQEAAARGQRTLLVERGRLAEATSSRSSKLIHGGLRYLETFQLRLVRESLRERAILLRIAPHLVRLIDFHIPVYEGSSRSAPLLRAGLSLYSLLAGGRRESWYQAVPREAWDGLDGLRTKGLRAVLRYADGATDDALLTQAVATSAVELGVHVRTHTEVLGGAWDGMWQVRLREASGDEVLVTSRAVVNAAGPWADRVASTFSPRGVCPDLDLVGGAHLELEGTLTRGAYYVESPRDQRAVFFIPWRGRTMVGTTETPWRLDPGAVTPSQDEQESLLAVTAHAFPGRSRRVLGAWAGLRVLPRSTERAFDRPREVLLELDGTRCPAFLTVVGGKLTGYRATAERVLDRLAGLLPVRPRQADTRTLLLPTPGPEAPAAVSGPPGGP